MLGQRYTTPMITVVCPVTKLHHMASLQSASSCNCTSYAVSADASSYGIGGVLMHITDGKQHPVAFCSRTLTVIEQQYAQIERECLACVWTCEKFNQYIRGLESYRLITDHKPLLPLIVEKDLNMVLLRCQRLLMRMMWFNPKPEYVAGMQLFVADQ